MATVDRKIVLWLQWDGDCIYLDEAPLKVYDKPKGNRIAELRIQERAARMLGIGHNRFETGWVQFRILDIGAYQAGIKEYEGDCIALLRATFTDAGMCLAVPEGMAKGWIALTDRDREAITREIGEVGHTAVFAVLLCGDGGDIWFANRDDVRG